MLRTAVVALALAAGADAAAKKPNFRTLPSAPPYQRAATPRTRLIANSPAPTLTSDPTAAIAAVILFGDDWGYGDIGANWEGDTSSFDKKFPAPTFTPNLDKLAASGIRFTQAHKQSDERHNLISRGSMALTDCLCLQGLPRRREQTPATPHFTIPGGRRL